MNEIINSKLKKFMADEVMSDAVYNLIHDSFLKTKGLRDVQILAAERLAVDFLEDAWKKLDEFKSREGIRESVQKNIGL